MYVCTYRSTYTLTNEYKTKLYEEMETFGLYTVRIGKMQSAEKKLNWFVLPFLIRFCRLFCVSVCLSLSIDGNPFTITRIQSNSCTARLYIYNFLCSHFAQPKNYFYIIFTFFFVSSPFRHSSLLFLYGW